MQTITKPYKLYIDLKILERRIIPYHFQVRVTPEDREIATLSADPTFPWSSTSFLVNRPSPPLGLDPLSPRKMVHGTYVAREGRRWPNWWQWVTQGTTANARPLSSTAPSSAIETLWRKHVGACRPRWHRRSWSTLVVLERKGKRDIGL